MRAKNNMTHYEHLNVGIKTVMPNDATEIIPIDPERES
jgi:hypothetical protein